MSARKYFLISKLISERNMGVSDTRLEKMLIQPRIESVRSCYEYPKAFALKLEKGERFSAAERREVIKIIVAAVMQRVPMPTEIQLEAVAKDLFKQYPKSFKEPIGEHSVKLGRLRLLSELIAETEFCKRTVEEKEKQAEKMEYSADVGVKNENNKKLFQPQLVESTQPLASVKESFPKPDLDYNSMLEKIPFDRFPRPFVLQLEKGQIPSAAERREPVRIIIAEMMEHIPLLRKKHLEAIVLEIARRYPKSFPKIVQESLLKQLIARGENSKRETNTPIKTIILKPNEDYVSLLEKIPFDKLPKSVISKMNKGGKISAAERSEAVRIIVGVFLERNPTIRKKDWEAIAMEIVRRFPLSFSDANSIKCPHGSLLCQLVARAESCKKTSDAKETEASSDISKKKDEEVQLISKAESCRKASDAIETKVSTNISKADGKGEQITSRSNNSRRTSSALETENSAFFNKKKDKDKMPVPPQLVESKQLSVLVEDLCPKLAKVKVSLVEKIPFDTLPKLLFSKLERGEILSAVERRQIVRLIIAELMEHRFLLRKKHLEPVAMEVVRRYPASFKDNVGKNSTKSAHISLRNQLIARAENVRRNSQGKKTEVLKDTEEKGFLCPTLRPFQSFCFLDEMPVEQQPMKNIELSAAVLESFPKPDLDYHTLLGKIPFDRFPRPLVLKMEKGERPSDAERRGLIRIIVTELMKYITIPRLKHLEAVAMEVVKRYPESLKDYIVEDSKGCVYKSLLRQLVVRVESHRRRLNKLKSRASDKIDEKDEMLVESQLVKNALPVAEKFPKEDPESALLLDKIPFDTLPKPLMSKMKIGRRPTAAERLEAVRIITASIMDFMPSPRKKHWEAVAMEVVRRYPKSFKDDLVDSTSLGHEGLLKQFLSRAHNATIGGSRNTSKKRKRVAPSSQRIQRGHRSTNMTSSSDEDEDELMDLLAADEALELEEAESMDKTDDEASGQDSVGSLESVDTDWTKDD